MLTAAIATLAALPVAGIVAKGLGAIAIIFLIGLVVGVMLTVMVTNRIRRLRR